MFGGLGLVMKRASLLKIATADFAMLERIDGRAE
jgi:hypothetical protein